MVVDRVVQGGVLEFDPISNDPQQGRMKWRNCRLIPKTPDYQLCSFFPAGIRKQPNSADTQFQSAIDYIIKTRFSRSAL